MNASSTAWWMGTLTAGDDGSYSLSHMCADRDGISRRVVTQGSAGY